MASEELIGIREASRRLGVSDTAVHKAIKSGRVTIQWRTESGRPLVGWPLIKAQWKANTDQSLQRKPLAADRQEPTASKPAQASAAPPPPDPAPNAPSYAQSRAIREAYQARLAKLDFEERSGRLVPADQVKADAFKAARQVRDAMMNIPDRVAMELANEFDPARIHEKLAAEIRVALESLAGAAE